MFNISHKIHVREIHESFVKELKYVSFTPSMQIHYMKSAWVQISSKNRLYIKKMLDIIQKEKNLMRDQEVEKNLHS